MSGRTTVNINGYTVDDDVTLSDDLFNISTAATLVLLGSDAIFVDDAVEGGGRVRVRGDLTTYNGLILSGNALFVDMHYIVQYAGDLILGQSASDAVTIRNLAKSDWLLTDGASIIGAGTSQFVNLGLLDQIGDNYSMIDANFYDRGGTIIVGGTLEFASPGDVNRFVDDTISGPGLFAVNGGVLVGSSISTMATEFDNARIVGNVQVSSQSVEVNGLNLGAGAILTLENSAASLRFGDNISGAGTIALTGNDNVSGPINLVGDVAFANHGNMTFDASGVSATPWAGDTVTIENQAGAVWTDIGYGGANTFASNGTVGTAVFVNDGTFIEDTSRGVTFGIDVENDGVMEPAAAPPVIFDSNTPYATNNTFALNSVNGAGTVDIGGAYRLSVGAVGSGQTLSFDDAFADAHTPILEIENPQGFAGTIAGFDQPLLNDLIIANTATWAYQDFVANSAGTGGSLMFTNGSAETAVNLSGSYDPSGFHSAVTGSTTTISYSG